MHETLTCLDLQCPAPSQHDATELEFPIESNPAINTRRRTQIAWIETRDTDQRNISQTEQLDRIRITPRVRIQKPESTERQKRRPKSNQSRAQETTCSNRNEGGNKRTKQKKTRRGEARRRGNTREDPSARGRGRARAPFYRRWERRWWRLESWPGLAPTDRGGSIPYRTRFRVALALA